MGSLLSLFRSKPDTKALLEKIQNEIESIQDFRDSASKREKNCICLLFLAFILVYLISAVVFYLFYLNQISLKSFTEIALSFLPFIVFPIIFFCFTRSLQFYYRWIADNKEDRLKVLKREKKKILEKVKETENFKNAKEILEKYDPKALMEGVSTPLTAFSSTPLNMTSFANTPQRSTDYRLRYRGNTSTVNRLPAILPAPSGSAQIRNQFNPIRPQNPNQRIFMTTPQRMPVMPPPMSTIKPILPQNRSIVEKVVDYMIKDGPDNRFALICNHCYSHNGMALKEEFEFISYICCYCKRFNPSRKTRPTAPQLKPLDKSQRNSLAPLIDEPESDTDSERGRISSDCTRIEEISSNPETDNQNQNSDSNENKDKTSTDPTEDTTVSKEDTTVSTEEETEKTIENETNESESKETTETDEKEDKNEAEIPFIDDSSL